MFELVKSTGLFFQLLELVVLRFLLGFELLSHVLQDVVLLNDLNPLQGGVDMWLCDAQFSQEGDRSLALLKLDFIMWIILKMHVNFSNHLLHLVVLLEQLSRLDCGAAQNLDLLDHREALRDNECKVFLVVLSVKDSRDFA